ncbi:leucine rich repeat family protein [Stylonychia lemnae]|uniref:Leucine rich repeat family protein n=1 Tax=Stylonychia lemnae TaxID=5949 RepID=A0A077ZRM0_STYLE|nr:leucine rich repeat family protein [Stylonychia lemnae]|eukprot:CDW72568.1 leucine rich repeat family protein [Stylonychia lemnae]
MEGNQSQQSNSRDAPKKENIHHIQSTHLLKMNNTEKKLSFTDQNLTEVPKQLLAATFQLISHLDLSNNLITQITETLINCVPGLTTLLISSNKLAYFTPAIKRLRHLRVLKINSNCLNMIPNEIGDLFELEELDASDNKLFGLPDSICNLNQLKTLNIQQNMIRYLPPELDQMRRIECLYIDSNLFTSIPCSLGRLNNIKEFSLDWVKYVYVDPPLPIVIKTSSNQGQAFMEVLKKLCHHLVLQNDKYECDFVDFLRFLSESRFNINDVDSRQRTILHNACNQGDLGVIKSLILSGCDLNILDKDQCTPLCVAIREFKFDAAKLLIESGADVNIGGGIYGSALLLAVVRTDLQLVDMMIKRGAEVNIIDKDGNTPLHFIVNVFSKSETKYKAIAESLIMSGARPNQKNRDLWAPLHVAARKGQIEVIRWAKMANEILKELKMEIFDFNLPGGQEKWAPLHLAGYSGHYKVVEEILSGTLESIRQFPINVYARNLDFKTPRQCTKGNLVLTKIFRKAEKRYLKEIFELEWVNESQILVNHDISLNQDQKPKQINSKKQQMSQIDNLDAIYLPLKDQIEQIKHQKQQNSAILQRNQPEFKKLGKKNLLEKSLRLEQSRIIDDHESDQENDGKDLNFHKQYKKALAYNDLRKRVIQGDNDQNSIFVDLMKTMSPRTLGLKLQFFKSSHGVIAAGVDLFKFQKQLNDSVLLESDNKLKNRQMLLSPRAGRHINIFYLKDKIIDNKNIHEKFEALSILYKETKHQNYDAMLRQLIDRLPLLTVTTQFRCVVDEIVKLISSRGSVQSIDQAIKAFEKMMQNKEDQAFVCVDDYENYVSDLSMAKLLQSKIKIPVSSFKGSFDNTGNFEPFRLKPFQDSKSQQFQVIDLNMAGKTQKIKSRVNETPKLIKERNNKYFGM